MKVKRFEIITVTDMFEKNDKSLFSDLLKKRGVLQKNTNGQILLHVVNGGISQIELTTIIK